MTNTHRRPYWSLTLAAAALIAALAGCGRTSAAGPAEASASGASDRTALQEAGTSRHPCREGFHRDGSVRVPDVSGLTMPEAYRVLVRAGLCPSWGPNEGAKGPALHMTGPKAGEKIPYGTTVVPGFAIEASL